MSHRGLDALLATITLANGWTMRCQSPHTMVEKVVETAVGPKQAILCWQSRVALPPLIWARYDSEGRNIIESIQPLRVCDLNEEQARAEIQAMVQQLDAAIDGSYARSLWLKHRHRAPDTFPKNTHR